MDHKNILLITGIVISSLAIGIFETGVIPLSGPYIYGDENDIPLILKKGDNTFEIKPGEKVIINDHFYTYRSVDMITQMLMLENESIPLSNVSTIHYVTGTRMKELGLKGFLAGGLAGTAVGVAMVLPGGEYHYMIFTVPICAVLDATVFSIVGAGIGFTKQNYKTCVLGENEWKVINQ